MNLKRRKWICFCFDVADEAKSKQKIEKGGLYREMYNSNRLSATNFLFGRRDWKVGTIF